MADQLIIGILVNTLAFGAMAFIGTDAKARVAHKIPRFLRNKYLDILTTVIYFASFLIILFAPSNLIINIIICLLMQFLINHAIWGTITGLLSSKK